MRAHLRGITRERARAKGGRSPTQKGGGLSLKPTHIHTLRTVNAALSPLAAVAVYWQVHIAAAARRRRGPRGVGVGDGIAVLVAPGDAAAGERVAVARVFGEVSHVAPRSLAAFVARQARMPGGWTWPYERERVGVLVGA